jgi:hypothetical protein
MNSETEKIQRHRDNVISVKDRIKEINVDEILTGAIAQPYVNDDYLFIADGHSMGEQIHIFSKTDFRHLISTARKGRGPGEVVNLGYLVINDSNRTVYLTDHSKNQILSYPIDSMVSNAFYVPETKMNIGKMSIPSRYCLLDDSTALGVVIEPIGNSDFQKSIGIWDMNRGEVVPGPYMHPEIKKRRFDIDVSLEHGIFVTGYQHHDLMTICDLDGNLKYNVYGNAWDTTVSNEMSYHKKINICGHY